MKYDPLIRSKSLNSERSPKSLSCVYHSTTAAARTVGEVAGLVTAGSTASWLAKAVAHHHHCVWRDRSETPVYLGEAAVEALVCWAETGLPRHLPVQEELSGCDLERPALKKAVAAAGVSW